MFELVSTRPNGAEDGLNWIIVESTETSLIIKNKNKRTYAELCD